MKTSPATIVILGATGDLAAKKIFPSLWFLYQRGRLPERFSMIGVARREFSDRAFRELVREAVTAHGGVADEALFSDFLQHCFYHTASFDDTNAFLRLAEKISTTEKQWGVCGDKLYYLAVPPIAYEAIFRNLAASKLNMPCGGPDGWSRVLVEKPFGSDEISAEALNALLTSYFKEDQIYRIDHYLFKEIIQGIEHFRFSNNLFEHTWDATTIERIDIRLLENIGVEERGAFYDNVGALRDVGQNHLLAMLAAITMDPESPHDMTTIRDSRAEMLGQLRPWSDDLIQSRTYRAQHEGYTNIPGVSPGSQTETYFALSTELVHPRWRGVPVTLEAGKSTGESRKEIVLTLKHPKVCLLCEAGQHGANTITFRLEPNDEILIHFWTKKPGFERVLEERTFSFFLYEKQMKVQYVEEYSKVLFSALAGNQTMFVSQPEIKAMWQFTDPVVRAWKQGVVPLGSYKKDSKPDPQFLKAMPDRAETNKGSLGIIGLGKMGANLARNLHEKHWRVVGFNESESATRELSAEGILGAYSMRELVETLSTPRVLWLMVPHTAVDAVLSELSPLLTPGDVIIEGGNSPYRESMRRAEEMNSRGVQFLDVGVSGGPEGARTGACLMIGGDEKTFEALRSLFEDVAAPDAYRHVGKSGAGHFVKMVHNGIEYGMMESIAEGFHILKKAPFSLDLATVADLYQHQSVVTSRLVGWLHKGLLRFGNELTEVSAAAGASGEGAWTVDAARELGVEAVNIEHALDARKSSQQNPTFAGKIIQTMRNMFGGHTGTSIVS